MGTFNINTILVYSDLGDSVINEIEFGTTSIAGLEGETYYFKIWSGSGGGGGSRQATYGGQAQNKASRAILEVTLVADNDITYTIGPAGIGGAASGIYGGNGGNGGPGGTSSISIDGQVVVQCTGTHGGTGNNATPPTTIVGTATVNTDAARWTIVRSVTENSSVNFGNISWSEHEMGVNPDVPYQPRKVGTGGIGTLGPYGGSVGLIGSYGYIGIHKI